MYIHLYRLQLGTCLKQNYTIYTNSMCAIVEADKLLTLIKENLRKILRFTTRWKWSNFECIFQGYQLLQEYFINWKDSKKLISLILTSLIP